MLTDRRESGCEVLVEAKLFSGCCENACLLLHELLTDVKHPQNLRYATTTTRLHQGRLLGLLVEVARRFLGILTVHIVLHTLGVRLLDDLLTSFEALLADRKSVV